MREAPFAVKPGAVAPAWGNIQPFWENVGKRFATVDGAIAGVTDANKAQSYASVAAVLKATIADADTTWGAAVSAKTGKTFNAAFVAPLLARFGIDLNNSATLETLTREKRGEFYLAFYDGLMAYSGQDRTDHWMATANWSPAVTCLLYTSPSPRD